MKFYLKNIVNETNTNRAGNELYNFLNHYIIKRQPLELSLRESTVISSSFFNSSFGALIETYGFDSLRQYVKITEASKFQADVMKVYIDAAKKREEPAY